MQADTNSREDVMGLGTKCPKCKKAYLFTYWHRWVGNLPETEFWYVECSSCEYDEGIPHFSLSDVIEKYKRNNN